MAFTLTKFVQLGRLLHLPFAEAFWIISTASLIHAIFLPEGHHTINSAPSLNAAIIYQTVILCHASRILSPSHPPVLLLGKEEKSQLPSRERGSRGAPGQFQHSLKQTNKKNPNKSNNEHTNPNNKLLYIAFYWLYYLPLNSAHWFSRV